MFLCEALVTEIPSLMVGRTGIKGFTAGMQFNWGTIRSGVQRGPRPNSRQLFPAASARDCYLDIK